jgi:hypothetical protein
MAIKTSQSIAELRLANMRELHSQMTDRILICDPLDVGRMADIISNRDKLAEGIAGQEKIVDAERDAALRYEMGLVE